MVESGYALDMETPTVHTGHSPRTVLIPGTLWSKVETCVPEEERAEFLERALLDGLIRRAAERLKHYYETDEDALAWADFAGDLLDDEG